MPGRRVYSEDMYDLPMVGVPDWTLIEALADLFGPYALSEIHFVARDSRGSYDVHGDFQQFWNEVEQQEETPETIRVSSMGSEPDGTGRFLNAFTSTAIGSGARATSTDEAIVNHIATRIRELYAQAAQRLPAPPEAAAEGPPAEPSLRARAREFLYDPWVIAIGSGLILAILGLIFFG